MPKRHRLDTSLDLKGLSLTEECKEVLASTLRRRLQYAVSVGVTASELAQGGMQALTEWIYIRIPPHWFKDGVKMAEVPTAEDVAHQSKILCKEYLYQRLKAQNLLTVKAELRGAATRHSEVSQEIQLIASELERMYPDLYYSVSKQLNVTMTSDATVRKTLASLAEQLFKSTITWGKVVALFSLAGALACDCVSQGHPNFVTAIVDSFQEAVSKHLETWIIRQGGWTDVIRAFRTSKEAKVVWTLSLCGAIVGFMVTMGATMHL